MATRSKKRRTVVEVTHTVELDREDLLRAARVPKDAWDSAKVTMNAESFADIPAGSGYGVRVEWMRSSSSERAGDAGDEPDVDLGLDVDATAPDEDGTP